MRKKNNRDLHMFGPNLARKQERFKRARETERRGKNIAFKKNENILKDS